MSSPLSLQISHKGSNYPITLPSDATLATLKSSIAELTNVPPTNQKLLYKGKKPSHGDDTTLGDAGFKNGFKVQMLGNTEEEIGGMRKVEDEQKRREMIMRERQAKGTVKVRLIASISSSLVNTNEFMVNVELGPPHRLILRLSKIPLPQNLTPPTPPQPNLRPLLPATSLLRPSHPTRYANQSALRRSTHGTSAT